MVRRQRETDMNTRETNEVRESEIRELTAAELDQVTGAGLFAGISNAFKSVVKSVAPVD